MTTPDEYELAPCGFLSTAADGMIRTVNRTFLNMTGYDASDLVGVARFAELLSVGGRIYHETHYAPMLHMNGSAREIALDVLHRDGSVVPVLVNAVAEHGPDGSVLAVRLAVFEATHRREYERELLRAKARAEASEQQARALARTLQQILIPPRPPAIPHLDLAAEYRPAGDGTEVGGDFYDVFQVGAQEWVLAIGDVCGKGAQAAVVTALARDTLRAASMIIPSPADTLHRLNEVLLAFGGGRFCTVALLRLGLVDDSWRGTITVGGHPLPILRAADGGLAEIGRPGTVLGVIPDVRVHDVEFDLSANETLVCYTDGLTEGRHATEFYGEERVRSIMSGGHASAGSMATALLEDVMAFQGGWPRDDIAIVVVRAGV